MTGENDIIDDIIAHIRDACGNSFDAELDRVELKVRLKWGGTEPYISKNKHKKKEKRLAYMELQKGISPKEVAKKTGISRSLLYEMLKNRNNPEIP